MTNFRDLAAKLLLGEEITLSKERYDYDEDETGDAPTDHLTAKIEEFNHGAKDIVIYFSKELDKTIDYVHESYRLPYTEDIDLLEKIFIKAKKQFHWG